MEMPEMIKEIADFITTSVDDDGITNALKHYTEEENT